MVFSPDVCLSGLMKRHVKVGDKIGTERLPKTIREALVMRVQSGGIAELCHCTLGSGGK